MTLCGRSALYVVADVICFSSYVASCNRTRGDRLPIYGQLPDPRKLPRSLYHSGTCRLVIHGFHRIVQPL